MVMEQLCKFESDLKDNKSVGTYTNTHDLALKKQKSVTSIKISTLYANLLVITVSETFRQA